VWAAPRGRFNGLRGPAYFKRMVSDKAIYLRNFAAKVTGGK
jgi:hypothetical protein